MLTLFNILEGICTFAIIMWIIGEEHLTNKKEQLLELRIAKLEQELREMASE